MRDQYVLVLKLPRNDAALSEPQQRLNAALNQLAPTQRDLFRRHCIGGESIAQIAEILHYPPDAVGRSVCELRRRLRDLLIQSGFGPREAMDCLYQTLTRHP